MIHSLLSLSLSCFLLTPQVISRISFSVFLCLSHSLSLFLLPHLKLGGKECSLFFVSFLCLFVILCNMLTLSFLCPHIMCLFSCHSSFVVLFLFDDSLLITPKVGREKVGRESKEEEEVVHTFVGINSFVLTGCCFS